MNHLSKVQSHTLSHTDTFIYYFYNELYITRWCTGRVYWTKRNRMSNFSLKKLYREIFYSVFPILQQYRFNPCGQNTRNNQIIYLQITLTAYYKMKQNIKIINLKRFFFSPRKCFSLHSVKISSKNKPTHLNLYKARLDIVTR